MTNWRVEEWEDEDAGLFDIENMDNGDLPVEDADADGVSEFIRTHDLDTFTFKDDVQRNSDQALDYLREEYDVQ